MGDVLGLLLLYISLLPPLAISSPYSHPTTDSPNAHGVDRRDSLYGVNNAPYSNSTLESLIPHPLTKRDELANSDSHLTGDSSGHHLFGKRMVGRQINFCEDSLVFVASGCWHLTPDDKTWWRKCYDPNDEPSWGLSQWTIASCFTDETCETFEVPVYTGPRVYSVPDMNTVAACMSTKTNAKNEQEKSQALSKLRPPNRIRSGQPSIGTTRVAQRIPLLLQNPSGSAVVAAISGDDPTVNLNAKMTISAQKTLSLFDAKSYTTLDGGLSSCSNCEIIELPSLPKGTDSIYITGVFDVDTPWSLYFGLGTS
ncbi:hypothetical protein MMC20_007306 [Loxospora ochrophaea]|nr:hypothetical protein [Loxospora ochrophaea]